MEANQSPIPDVDALASALAAVVKLQIGKATGKEQPLVMMALRLECVGGPIAPEPHEVADRLRNLRLCLSRLLLRFSSLPHSEFPPKFKPKKARGYWPYVEEAERLEDAAATLFQLNRGRPDSDLGLTDLYGLLNQLWGKKPSGAWFKRERQDFVFERLSEWLIEHESEYRHGATERDREPDPPPLPPPPQKSTKLARVEKGLPAVEKRLPAVRRRPIPVSKRRLVAALVIASVMAVGIVLAIYREAEPGSVRNTADPVSALECGDREKTEDYSINPGVFPDNLNLVNPRNLSVSVGQLTFWFKSMNHYDRTLGSDSWDFNFKSPDTSALSFIYRDLPVGGAGFGYVVDGSPGEGLEPSNKVCNLIDFHKTAMGEFLKDHSDDEGFEWALRDTWGRQSSGHKSGSASNGSTPIKSSG